MKIKVKALLGKKSAKGRIINKPTAFPAWASAGTLAICDSETPKSAARRGRIGWL